MTAHKRFLLIGGFLLVLQAGILFFGGYGLSRYEHALKGLYLSPILHHVLEKTEASNTHREITNIHQESMMVHPMTGYGLLGWVLFPEHLAGAFTGGFGEQTCHSCHFDYDLNMDEGVLKLIGLPEKIQPSAEYELTVEIGRPELGAAGFQLTSRFADGTQAGEFILNDEVSFTPSVGNNIQYMQHAIRNIRPDGDNKTWKFTWTAPSQVSSTIYFHLAGNAANGDESAFEDWILTREYRVE